MVRANSGFSVLCNLAGLTGDPCLCPMSGVAADAVSDELLLHQLGY